MNRVVPCAVGSLLAALLNVGCGGAAPATGPAPAVQIELASFGGTFQAELDRAVVQPTAAALGLRAHVTAYSGEYDRLAASIRTNSNTLDLVHVESSFIKAGGRAGLLAPVDWQVVHRDLFVPGATEENGVAALAWSLVLSWNSSRLTGGAVPATWADLFDIKRFPGPRCMRKIPEGNIELALLADGVAPSELYAGGQLDVERALRRLSTIKSNIAWWSSGSELEQKMTSECSLGAAWDGRIQNLRASGGQPVDFTYRGGVNQYDWWVIPMNAPHKADAMRFLNGLGAGTGQGVIAEKFGYGPVARIALEQLPTTVRPHISSAPENVTQGVSFDAGWWASNTATVTERWNRWLLEK